MRKTGCVLVLFFSIVFGCTTFLSAEEVGRYQAVRMGETSIFILDTKEGHMWLQSLNEVYDSKRTERYLYLGKIEVGKSPLLEYEETLKKDEELKEKEVELREKESERAFDEKLEEIKRMKESESIKELILKE